MTECINLSARFSAHAVPHLFLFLRDTCRVRHSIAEIQYGVPVLYFSKIAYVLLFQKDREQSVPLVMDREG